MTWLLLLSVLLLVTVAVTASMALIQNRMQLVNLCRIESLKTQTTVEPTIKRLFALNPESRLLRVLLLAAKARLAAAVAHYNVPMAARARYEISQIKNKQEILDQTQRMLIQTANIQLHIGTLNTYAKLQDAFREITDRSSSWAEIDYRLENPKIPKLAVKAEDQFLAPAYLARDNFEIKQTSSQFWSQAYKSKGLLKFIHNSNSQCHATLEENTWEPKIRRDKLYSRWL